MYNSQVLIFPFRKRFGKDSVILSDIRKPPDHIFHSGKRSRRLAFVLSLIFKMQLERWLMGSAHNQACDEKKGVIKAQLCDF